MTGSAWSSCEYRRPARTHMVTGLFAICSIALALCVQTRAGGGWGVGAGPGEQRFGVRHRS